MSSIIYSINVWNQNKLIPSQVHDWCLIQTGQNHCETTKAHKIWLHLTSRETSQVQNRKFMYMNDNDITIFFFVRLSDKYRLLGLCIKYSHLMKDV